MKLNFSLLQRVAIQTICLLACILAFLPLNLAAADQETYDIVVYGGTSAGVIAAAQAANMGKSVVLIEPGNHLGGMTSSGLGWVDIKLPKAIGGMTLDYFHRVWQYYQNPSAWIWEEPYPIKGQLIKFHPNDPHMWVIEPHVGEKIFNAIVSEAEVPVVFLERLNRNNGVCIKDQRIVQIVMESGLAFNGKMFIDATYEGDLMAAAGVSYTVGREPNSLHQETLNGIHVSRAKTPGLIDCYLDKNVPQSGLLPRVYPNIGGTDGDGDKGVQAYNYRLCLTEVPQNRVQIEKPENYDEREYEILFRAIAAGLNAQSSVKLDLIPNRKTDSNNNGPVSTDYVGMSADYPEADYEARKQIALKHEQWQRGLIWTLQNHPRIPDQIKAYYAPWGLAKDEFIDNNNWPYLLYIREARRMISSVVIHENTTLGNVHVQDSIGLAIYDIDSHATGYLTDANGSLMTDGCIFKKILNPYPISYRAIIPVQNECENLLVPVCLSATHVAYGSLRVEPTFMVLGQSAATAASLAIDLNVALQNLPYDILRTRLMADGQILD